jgi:MoaA/NifB/PqqE/SkfB family radical SAM enzyme
MTSEIIAQIIDQARQVKTIEWIYFEGGEPFLYYPILIEGVNYAKQHKFNVGIVTNGYWASDVHDALLWLRPLRGKIDDLSVSSDSFHSNVSTSPESQNILQAAEQLDIPAGIISISHPNDDCDSGSLMYRGRAAEKLASGHENKKKESLRECPYEDLASPGRFHVDPFGYIHICQGIIAGNLFRTPLIEIIASYDPQNHPIISQILEGGPLKLAQIFDIPTRPFYADACQLCYEARKAIRVQNAQFLQPDAMYGV